MKSRILFGLATVVVLAAFFLRSTAGAADKIIPSPVVDEPLASVAGKKTVVFAGGCFWGIQAVYKHTKGVIRSTSGYSGGEASTAEYETVSTGNTGHAESSKLFMIHPRSLWVAC